MIQYLSRRAMLATMGVACVTAVPFRPTSAQTGGRRGGGQIPDPVPFPSDDEASPMDRKRQQEYLKLNLEKMRKDAAELAKLSASIREDLEKITENELPLRLVSKAEEVEKLAKRIKKTAKGF